MVIYFCGTDDETQDFSCYRATSPGLDCLHNQTGDACVPSPLPPKKQLVLTVEDVYFYISLVGTNITS